MDIKSIVNQRYSTKAFDPTRKISDEDMELVKSLLRMSPSSTNLQPWHFIIGSTEEGKERIAKGTEGAFAFNRPKVMDASHVIVYCARVEAEEEYLLKLLAQEEADGRIADEEAKKKLHGARSHFVNLHQNQLKDMPQWLALQTYLNMGTLLLGVAALGIDAVPMEGVDTAALDEEFGLREKGYRVLAAVSLGYHADSDFNAKLPKSRLPESEIITEV